MATYRSIALSETDANSPVTQTLMEALADNPTAIAEGASGAPKLAVNQASAIAGASSNLVFSGLDDFSGLIIRGSYASSDVSTTVTFEISTDGASYTDTTTIIDAASIGKSSYEVFFDFDTGSLECVYLDNITAERVTATLAGASLSITHVRLNTSTDIEITAMCYPNGGRSTT